MARMYFAKTVKYEKHVYPPNTVFDVKDEDVNELKMVGGWLVEESKQQKVVIEEKQYELETEQETEIEQEADELQELKSIARSMGIRIKKSWDVNKLKAEILAAKDK